MIASNVRVYTEPTQEPVSILEAIDHLRVSSDEENALIGRIVTAARRTAEMISRRALVTRTLDALLDTWPRGSAIELAYPPLQSITSVTYIDSDGGSNVMSSADYFADAHSEPGRLVLAYNASWPSATLRPAAAITIRYVAGYGDPDDVPDHYKQAIMLLVGHFYENREAVIAGQGITISQLPLAVDALLMIDRGSF